MRNLTFALLSLLNIHFVFAEEIESVGPPKAEKPVQLSDYIDALKRDDEVSQAEIIEEEFEKLAKKGQEILEKMRENFDRDQIVNQKDPVMKARSFNEISQIARTSKYERPDAVELQEQMNELAKVAAEIDLLRKCMTLVDAEHFMDKIVESKIVKKHHLERERDLPQDVREMLEASKNVLETIEINPSNWIMDVYEDDLKNAQAAVNKALQPPKVRGYLTSKMLRQMKNMDKNLELSNILDPKNHKIRSSIILERTKGLDTQGKIMELIRDPKARLEMIRKIRELSEVNKLIDSKSSSFEVFESVQKKLPGASDECINPATTR